MSNPPSSKKIRSIQLELAKKVLAVCQKHNLLMVACGGTAIGAVREKGFIPWDDDIDFEMLRPDYDKLVSVAQEEFQHPYFFQCAYTDNKYVRAHAQVRMDGTAAILPADIFSPFHQGIFIDIFVLDTIPANEPEMENLKKKTEPLKRKMEMVAYRSLYLHSLNPLYKIKGIISFFRYHQQDSQELFKEYEDIFRAQWDNDASEVCLIAYSWKILKKYRRSKKIMDEIKFFPFEDISMPVSGRYHEILTREFGDYMTPIQGPSAHGQFAMLDPDHSYEEFLPKLRRFYTIKKLFQIIKNYFRK